MNVVSATMFTVCIIIILPILCLLFASLVNSKVMEIEYENCECSKNVKRIQLIGICTIAIIAAVIFLII